MKKFVIISAVVLAALAVVSYASAISMFTTAVATNTATSTYNIVDTVTSDTLTFDAFAEGNNFKADEAYVLLQQVASTSASQLAITVSYSQDGIDYWTDNVATTTTGGNFALGNTPRYTLLGNDTSSTTRVAFKIETPTRFTRLTFTGLVGTSSVYAKVLPITSQ